MKKQYIKPFAECEAVSEEFEILAGSPPIINNTEQKIGDEESTDITGNITPGNETVDDEGALSKKNAFWEF